MCSETQATSGYLNHEPRTEAQALADVLEKGCAGLSHVNLILPRYSYVADVTLIIRALRAYKPAPVTDRHHEFDGGAE